jgi:nicotinate-nucleotide adenylyltransferase
MRVGVFGGTFDPIHVGHVAIAAEVCARLELASVRIVPCLRPPHKDRPDLTPGADRLAMIALATQDRPELVPSSFELTRQGPSYTIDTLDRMAPEAPGARLFFLMGMDSFTEIGTWKDHQRLLESYHMVVVNRPGSPAPPPHELPAAARGREVVGEAEMDALDGRVHLLELEPFPASSSEIRRRARLGKGLGGMVPSAVESYIHRCAIYR